MGQVPEKRACWRNVCVCVRHRMQCGSHAVEALRFPQSTRLHIVCRIPCASHCARHSATSAPVWARRARARNLGVARYNSQPRRRAGHSRPAERRRLCSHRLSLGKRCRYPLHAAPGGKRPPRAARGGESETPTFWRKHTRKMWLQETCVRAHVRRSRGKTCR